MIGRHWALRVGVLGLSLFALTPSALALTNSATPAAAPTTSTTTSTAPSQTKTVTQTNTVSAPPKTTTVTAPTQTNTVIKTHTVTTPTTTSTSTSHAPAAAAAGAAAAANKEPSSESSGLPGWAWALIGAAVAGGAIGILTLFRRGRNDGPPSDGMGGPGASGDEPPAPNAPPRA